MSPSTETRVLGWSFMLILSTPGGETVGAQVSPHGLHRDGGGLLLDGSRTAHGYHDKRSEVFGRSRGAHPSHQVIDGLCPAVVELPRQGRRDGRQRRPLMRAVRSEVRAPKPPLHGRLPDRAHRLSLVSPRMHRSAARSSHRPTCCQGKPTSGARNRMTADTRGDNILLLSRHVLPPAWSGECASGGRVIGTGLRPQCACRRAR